jgi:hypothetical protein
VGLRLMIYDIASRARTDIYDSMSARRREELSEALNKSEFTINVRRRGHLGYMENTQRFLRNRLRGRFRSDYNRIPFQFDFEILFAFTDGSTVEQKEMVVRFARNVHSYMRDYFLNEFNNFQNELDLRFYTFDTRCFTGLYEINNEFLRNPNDVMRPITEIVRNRNSFLKFRNYTPGGYIENNIIFYRRYVDEFLEKLNHLEPEFNVQEYRDEIERYEETHVLESPGLSLQAFSVLLDLNREEVTRCIYVSWHVRLGFTVDSTSYNRFQFRNFDNLETNYDNDPTPQNRSKWRTDIFRLRGLR